ncbi:MAG: flagellar biosynthesis protein FlhF [Proteobacteria bacterium SG_bin9]|nr:MAG: flagellar biosynthesis protein FlhF [Proteobacteria bacterium SG_bin9]
MTKDSLFPGFDGLMTLSRREGVDIRPTLLRVLTDLYVQAGSHTKDEESQFVELTSRLIDEVDDATRAAVRARLAIYQYTPEPIREKLNLSTVTRAPLAPQSTPMAAPVATPITAAPETPAPFISPDVSDTASLHERFFTAGSRERIAILNGLADSSLKQAGRTDAKRRQRSIETLEMAAFAVDAENFTREVGDALLLPQQLAERIVGDAGGEPLAVAMKALGMPSESYQRVLLFLDPQVGSSVVAVFTLARLYDRISEQSALTMLGVWRNASAAMTRARFRPSLHDDERQRARPAFGQVRPAQPRSIQSDKSSVRR